MNQKIMASAVIILATMALTALSVSAQIQPKYKEGDRVEVDVIMQSNPANAKWKPGTVIEVDMSAVQYVVQIDPLPGQLPMIRTIPIRDYAEKWIRPGGGAGPQIQSDKLRVDTNDTVLADRELLDCKNLKQPKRITVRRLQPNSRRN